MDDVRYSGENKISINLVTVENKILEKMRRRNSRWLYSNLKMPFMSSQNGINWDFI